MKAVERQVGEPELTRISVATRLIPHAGQVVPHAGQVVPHAGQVVPHTGQVVPHTGQVVPHTGQVVPHTGQVVPHAGQVVPHAGQVVPHAGQVVPHAGQIQLIRIFASRWRPWRLGGSKGRQGVPADFADQRRFFGTFNFFNHATARPPFNRLQLTMVVLGNLETGRVTRCAR